MARLPAQSLTRQSTSLLPTNLTPAENQFFKILLGNAASAQNILATALKQQEDAEAGALDANSEPIEPISPEALASISHRALRTVREMYEILELKARLGDREGTGSKHITARIGIRQADGTEAVAEVNVER